MSEDAKALVAQIETIGATALKDVEACGDAERLEQLRVLHLGRKSELAELMRRVKGVPANDRPQVGKVANEVKTAFNQAVTERKEKFESGARRDQLAGEKIDVTLPGRPADRGHLHPTTLALDEIEGIFTSMGFSVATGPEMEEEYYNFEALNIPADHPARDMHDTFYLKGGGVLRTHTSPVQIRAMRRLKPPLAIIAPGKVYRCDADSTHSPMFHQIEGFLVDSHVRFSDLKGVLALLLRKFFGPKVKFRFRPSYFPFTEPSAEVDVLWQGPGRPEEWIEVLGSGMIHPKVLEAGGYDPARVTGFAFGVGVERFAMLKYGIPNIRLFFENDLRFMRQF